jgi:hypothetical protein
MKIRELSLASANNLGVHSTRDRRLLLGVERQNEKEETTRFIFTRAQKSGGKGLHTSLIPFLNLCILLRPQLGGGVSDPNGELLGPLDDQPPDARADGVGDGRGVRPIVHHEHFQVRHVRHDDALEPVGEDVARLLVRAVPDRGHGEGALEAAAHATVDTLGFAPG